MKNRLTIILFLFIGIELNAQFFLNVADIMKITLTVNAATSYGTGASFVDFNNDGWDDLTLATGFGDSTRFFVNTNGSFLELPNLIGTTLENKQVLWVDYDNDGDKDLFLTSTLTYSRLYRNDTMHFTDVTASAGLSLTSKETYGAAWADFNKDGLLDLYEVNQPTYGNGQNDLYLNNGNGLFTNVTLLAGVGDAQYNSFMPCFFDANTDGLPDLFITNDRMDFPSLYINNGDTTFTNLNVQSGLDSILNGMGVAIGDFDNDLDLDFYLTNTDEGNFLYQNNGKLNYADIADSMEVLFFEETWACVFIDYDLDKDLDLYVSGSWDAGNGGRSSTMYRNDDSIFTEPTIGFIGDTIASYANAVGDYNNDGLVDIVVPNRSPYRLHLWKNQNQKGKHWLKVNLSGTVSNRDAIGTTLYLYSGGTPQMRYTTCGTGYLSQHSTSQFFGLDQDTIVDSLHLIWPNGYEESYYNLSVDTNYYFVEGQGISSSQVIISGNLYVCKGDSIQTQLSTSFISDSILWNTGDTTSVIQPDTPGNYFYVVKTPLGIWDTSNTVIINEVDLLLSTITTPDSTNTGTGTAFVTVQNGTSPITYMWNDPQLQSTALAEHLYAGTYMVKVQDSLGCIDSAMAVIATTFSVEEIALSKINIFPNPANTYAHLNNIPAGARIKLFNAQGKELKNVMVSDTNYEINTDSWPSGVYMLQMGYKGYKREFNLIVQH